MPKDFNAERAARATSDRDFTLGPYTFRRVVSARPEVLTNFNRPDQTSVDEEVIRRFDNTILELLEPYATMTDTGERVDTSEAWQIMRQVGDENGVVSFVDMGEVVTLLLGGVVERPTGQPSDSPDGSETPNGGTSLTGISPSAAPTSPPSTPAALSTPYTPAS